MRAPATRHVVDRCPSCGVEHDVRVHACEACHTPLRPWCRVHGMETGWLDGPSCQRCAEEAARPPPAVPAPVLGPPAPAAVPAPAGGPRAEVAADAAKPTPESQGWADVTGAMFMMLFFTVAAGAFGGVVLSTPFVFGGTEVHLDTLVKFAVGGGAVGLPFGVYFCRMYAQHLRAKARKP